MAQNDNSIAAYWSSVGNKGEPVKGASSEKAASMLGDEQIEQKGIDRAKQLNSNEVGPKSIEALQRAQYWNNRDLARASLLQSEIAKAAERSVEVAAALREKYAGEQDWGETRIVDEARHVAEREPHAKFLSSFLLDHQERLVADTAYGREAGNAGEQHRLAGVDVQQREVNRTESVLSIREHSSSEVGSAKDRSIRDYWLSVAMKGEEIKNVRV